MSQRFVRCARCGLPHDARQAVCPTTGMAVRPRSTDRPAHEAPAGRPNAAARGPGGGARRDLVGKTISGKYFVRSALGEGGMGTVFEAEHLTIGRSVAVKVLHPNQGAKRTLCGASTKRRARQEA